MYRSSPSILHVPQHSPDFVDYDMDGVVWFVLLSSLHAGDFLCISSSNQE